MCTFFPRSVKLEDTLYWFWPWFLIFILQPSNGSEPTVGKTLLKDRGLFTTETWYWIGVGALFAFSLLFNVLFIGALTFLNREYKSPPCYLTFVIYYSILYDTRSSCFNTWYRLNYQQLEILKLFLLRTMMRKRLEMKHPILQVCGLLNYSFLWSIKLFLSLEC